MIRIVFTIQLVFLKKPFYAIVTIMLLFMLGFVTGIFLSKAPVAMVNSVSFVVTLLVLSWVVFVVVLRYTCTRRCLVGQ